MRAIDIHAHLVPDCLRQSLYRVESWHGITGERDVGGQLIYGLGERKQALGPASTWNVEQRLADMDSLGVDVHVVSTFIGYYRFESDDQAIAACRETNDEVAKMITDYPSRFAGLCTLPMQNVRAAITELERGMTQLGLKGAMINDTVNGRTFDEPEFLPLWQAAEQMGALMFIHQGGDTLVTPRLNRYHLPNTIGNLVDRAVTFASFVFGGVMDACPDLKVCLAHGGGYTCFVIGRMDRGWQVRSEARVNIQQPPSKYLSRFYYDCLTHSEAALRYLIDTVGVNRVVFGTDWPADMAIDWPVSWILSLESLTQEEKEAILWKNLEKLLGI
jgi:aminocarboxymuconate-semialdehyde decarboxylase